MKQSKLLRRMSVAIVAVLLITMSVLSVTLAKYSNTFTGTSTGKVLKWEITANEAQSTFTVDAGNLCPGMVDGTGKVQKEIIIKNSGEINADFTVTLGETQNKPANLNITLTQVKPEGVQADITVLEAGKEVKYILEYSWPYEGTDGTAQAGVSLTTTINVTATQVKVTPAV